MRPITGGSPARSAASSRSAEREARAIPHDGSVEPGSEPPPVVALSGTGRAAPPTAAARADARASSPASGAASIRQVGISRVARPAR